MLPDCIADSSPIFNQNNVPFPTSYHNINTLVVECAT